MTFNPFIDASQKTDEVIVEDIGKINERINYYQNTKYTYLIPQLTAWRQQYYDVLSERLEAKRREKEKKTEKIFDTAVEEDVKKED